MGEVAMRSDMEIQETGGGTEIHAETKNDVVRWEKFLPKMVLRVLLVEADDSTRQIITALLRKCSYKVAAVSDGLKAWEVLKGRPHGIDLILTEVELPSISGFALLTLIAEHEVCKNIPVIMMSAHDSVSTVYKCMLRGAADFLVKPVRKNELQNLWQHVWRRQTASSGGPQAVSDAQQKVEATAENNATSNHSSGYEACIQRNRECIEKGSDAQSSCTKPDFEAEGPHLQHRKDLIQPKQSKPILNDMNIEAQGRVFDVSNTNAKTTSSRGDAAADSHRERVNVTLDDTNVHVNSSREAIDLIGAFDNYPKCSYRSLGSNLVADKVDSSSLLDLSLRRSHPSGSVNQVMDDGHTLKQSDASAFSRYVSRTFQPHHSTSATKSDKCVIQQALDYNSYTRGPVASHDNNMISLTNSQPEIRIPYPQRRVIPVTVPVRDLRLESLCTAYGSVMPPVFCSQSSRSPMHSPGSSGQQEPSFQLNQTYPFKPETRNSQQLHSEDRGHFSSATDQSGSSSFCNGTLGRFNSINSASNGNVVPAVKIAGECGIEATLTNDGNCHRSTLREAALTKFRMKRKDRCYEKKVRYESRKKLAEQRPRVKGQFVRQVQSEAPSTETDDHFVNSLAS